jgi:GAF domain-containing protein
MGERISEARMLAALSATNEAVLRAQSLAELFQRVCEAAVDGGGLCLAAAILPDSEGFLRFAAQASDARGAFDPVISIDAERDDGQGSPAPRSGRAAPRCRFFAAGEVVPLTGGVAEAPPIASPPLQAALDGDAAPARHDCPPPTAVA